MAYKRKPYVAKKVIGTHSPKIFDARIQQSAITADIKAELLPCFISSQTIKCRRKYWAMSKNAADMKLSREAAKTATQEPEKIPDFESGELKQILLPYFDSYVCAAPVPAASVLHEIYSRLEERKAPFKKWILQPTPAAYANHGEIMLEQHGKLKLFISQFSLSRKNVQINQDNIVKVTFYLENFNISGGMVATGMPAIAAIGGAVHAIERSFGADIDFAFGIKTLNFFDSCKRAAQIKSNKIVPKILSDEINGSGQVVLLLRSDKKRLEKHLQKQQIKRFAGGTVWDFKTEKMKSGDFVSAQFVTDNTNELDVLLNSQNDALDAAIDLYQIDFKKEYTKSINHVGYALLNEPALQKKCRAPYPAAWAEPIFGAIALTDFSEKVFWHRKEAKNAVFWTAKQL